MRSLQHKGVALALSALLLGCQRDQSPFHFVDVSREAGLDFRNVSGSPTQNYVLESMSAGAAFFDYDNDGFQDLFVVNGTRLEYQPEEARNRLFRNEPGADGARVFRPVQADLGRGGWGMGCAVGDYDNDGDVDLYVTYWGPNQLWRNDRAGRFAEVAVAAGVDDKRWGSSAAFGDVDRDGWLDLYVANYLEFDLDNPPAGGSKCHYKGLYVYCGPEYAGRQADRMYRNRGDGTFADLSDSTGVGALRYPAMGVVFNDLDRDGDLDLYVANDTEPNLLWRNDGAWQLAEVAVQAGAAYSGEGRPQASMGLHAGDFDSDGDLDLFATHFSDELNTLYCNEAPGHFRDCTREAGLGQIEGPYLGWGTAFVDLDRDGWLDLFVANGHVYPQLDQSYADLRYAQRNLLYRNEGGRFREVGKQSGAGWALQQVSRAAAVGDYDNDGDVDIFIMNLNDAPTLLRNDSAADNRWLGLRLVSAQGRIAIGAEVQVQAGGRRQVREVHRGYSFQAQHDPRLLFGLGSASEVEQVEIRWPSGRRQVLPSLPTGRYVEVVDRP